MLSITKTYRWVSCLACLAIALTAGNAIADHHEEDSERHESQRQSSDDDSQSHDSDKQKADKDKQRSDQPRQRAEQEKQRAEQDRQGSQQERQSARNQRSSQRSDEKWNEDRGFPQPNRDSYSRSQSERDAQWNRDQQRSNRNQQYSRSSQGNRDAGLGVSIAQEGREQGLTVIRVHQNSPAEEMGLREGDRITRLNGERVRSTEQFISEIRNMQPGEQVELDVTRNRQDRTVRGELDTRQDALVLRGERIQSQQDSWRQGRATRQSGYEEGRSYSQSSRSGNVDQQINQIERQLSQMSREINDLRSSLRDLRNQTGRSGEMTAGYEESRTRQGARTSDRSQDRQRQYDGSRDSQRSYQDGQRSSGEFGQYDERSGARQYNEYESTGGETGEARIRPDRN